MVNEGDRIELIEMGLDPFGRPDPNPIEPGTRGTVQMTTVLRFPGEPVQTQVVVKWDNGRRLHLVCPPDVFRIVREHESPAEAQTAS